MTVLDHHLRQADSHMDTRAIVGTIGMIVTLAAIAFMGIAALTAPASEPNPEAWHGNSAAMRPLAR